MTKLTRENYLQFRYAFVEEFNHHEILSNNENPEAMKIILSVLTMIMCKRVPEGVVPFKVDDLAKKIRLMPIPKGLETIERQTIERVPPSEEFPEGKDEFINVPRNTGEMAVVRILIK